MQQQSNYAGIVFNLPIESEFHYSIPEHMRRDISIGMRVWAPFRNREQVGIVTGFSDVPEVIAVKDITSIIDKSPILSRELMGLAAWIKDTYLCALGEALFCMVPSALKGGRTEIRKRSGDIADGAQAYRDKPLVLTEEQAGVLRDISQDLESKRRSIFLLHGITGSGKTEVYLQVIDKLKKSKSSTIVLVPEISLTPQTVRRFVSRFGDQVAVIHSRLTGSERYAEWKRIREGRANIVIGARSAIFSPVRNLGLIIVDEEHETSYKQEDVPRYHARDVACKRAELSGCSVILGTATPSLESYYNAKTGVYKLLKLTKRIDSRQLPRIKIVDMRMESATRKKVVMFSKIMTSELEKIIKEKKQAIVFLNRRGFSTYISCTGCGHVMKCKRCDAILVYHYDKKALICHYCDKRIAPPDICPKCRGTYVKYFGIGTEKVESELARIVPSARICRMDTDTTRKRGSHDRILDGFREHKYDILVGTQMIAKGLDFPKVTLVGLVNSDVTLNLPDFRAGERTFTLITQVAGRAGRGEDGGEVVLQTYAPSHYSILTASKHDYEKFYEHEIVSRKDLKFPPFVSLIKITFRSKCEDRVKQASTKVALALRNDMKDADITGPAPASISKLRGYYRWNLLLKGKNRSIMSASLRDVLRRIRKPSGVLMAVDVDPMSM